MLEPVVEVVNIPGGVLFIVSAGVAVVITAGDTESFADGFQRVPKRNLVSTGQVLLQSGRIKIHSSLPLADTLTKELLAFKVTITAKENDTYANDWRENPHDDLVLSTLLAAYWGEKSHDVVSVGASVR